MNLDIVFEQSIVMSAVKECFEKLGFPNKNTPLIEHRKYLLEKGILSCSVLKVDNYNIDFLAKYKKKTIIFTLYRHDNDFPDNHLKVKYWR